MHDRRRPTANPSTKPGQAQFGGEILGTAGKILLKIPGARSLVARVGESALARVLATDVGYVSRRTAYKTLQRMGPIGERASAIFGSNAERGALAEAAFEAKAIRRGATVFQTQTSMKPGAKGIDRGSIEAGELFLNEVKWWKRSVGSTDITSFGLQYPADGLGEAELLKNLNRASRKARAAGLFDVPEQIAKRDFTARMIAGPGTRFEMSEIAAALSATGINRVAFERVSWFDLLRYIARGK